MDSKRNQSRIDSLERVRKQHVKLKDFNTKEQEEAHKVILELLNDEIRSEYWRNV